MRAFKPQFIPKPSLTVPQELKSSVFDKELEIGAGNGEFALQRARSQPNIQFIAIEKSRALFYRLLKNSQKLKLPNLWVFHTNAVWWITHFVELNSLSKVYILYPNLYKKSQQSNLRWFNRPFMFYLLKCLKIKGELEIRTNNKNYYEECKKKMNQYLSIQRTQDFRITNFPSTAFERKYMQEGQICRALVYKKLCKNI